MTTQIKLIALACVAVVAVAGDAAAAQSSADARARETLRQMTLDERLEMLRGINPFSTKGALPDTIPRGAGYVKGVPRLGVPPLVESDASLGVANMLGSLRKGDVATALPSGAAMASSWDTDLVERAGAMIGSEARAKGFNVLLAGGVNLVREPRNGRNFEYLGEDPLLAGRLGGHAIKGVQSAKMISTIKHYALNAQETGRTVLSANLDEAALRQSDLLAFQIAIEIGQPGSVMCGYNQVNGVYACENNFLLNDVLRGDWKYPGFVMSDWGAVHSTSIRQGLDQESGGQPKDKGYFGPMLRNALSTGAVRQADIDRSVLRILRTMYETGVVDEPVVAGKAIDYEANGRVAQAVAEAGVVLLRNERGLLPIAAQTRKILVVGGHADLGVPSGGGSSQVYPVGGPALSAPGPGGRSLYAPSSPLRALREALPDTQITFDDGTDAARAAREAGEADLVVVFAVQLASEGSDLASLSLSGNQDDLIAAVAAANPRTAVVLQTGGAVLMPWLDKVEAVVEAWYSGQRGGQAVARVLTGAVNPSGRLPMTFPTDISQTPNPKLPGIDTHGIDSGRDLYDLPEDQRRLVVTYPEGADVGYRWYDKTGAKPLFAFGHGLSYTRFDYGGLKLSGGSQLRVAFDVKNTGDRAGIEVAQVYARVDGVRRLVGWGRVDLKPGQTKRVSVLADPRLLARYDVQGRRWVVSGGAYGLEISRAADAPVLKGEVKLKARFLRP